MSAPRPHVVLIVADDLGWGELGAYGSALIPTPAIDGIAAEGARYTDAHASSSVCTPSRYGILTGRHAWRGPLAHGVIGPYAPPLIETGRATLASVLSGAGYRTGAFGKWHLGLGWRREDGSVADAAGDPASLAWPGGPERPDLESPFLGGPTALGFDRFFGTAGSLDMPPYAFLDQDRLSTPLAGAKETVGGQTPGPVSADWRDADVDVRIVDEAVRWISQDAEGPFFAYVALHAPHRPHVPPAFAQGASRAGVRGDAVTVVDWAVARIRDALVATGVLDDTLLVVTSDNGAPTRFPEESVPAHRPNGEWRGQKADIWEGGHRVPLVMRWPGRIPSTTVESTVCLTDLLPTIAAAAGAELPAGAAPDGRDLLPLLADRALDTDAPAIVHQADDGTLAVRVGSFKAIFGTGSGGFSHPIGHPVGLDERGRLLDLSLDPREEQDVWDSHPEVAAELGARLRAVRGAGA